MAYQKASEGFEVAKVAGAMAAEAGVELTKPRGAETVVAGGGNVVVLNVSGVTGVVLGPHFLTWPESVTLSS